MNTEILQGDCLEVLQGMDSESVDMCMTSPPYWGLRDYGSPMQLGLESTYQEYIDKLIAIFDEVKRVLKDSGTCWVNLGDTYGNSNTGGNGATGGRDKSTLQSSMPPIGTTPVKRDIKGLDKSLIGIPERFAIAMTDAGWIRRNTIIWHKPNCMPSSANDRFTVDFEYLYFFTKNTKYWFEQQFEDMQQCSIERANRAISGDHKYHDVPGQSTQGIARARKAGNKDYVLNLNGRNKRCVWKIPTQSYSDAHFATYPEELVYTPIKAGSPKYCCPKCNKGVENA